MNKTQGLRLLGRRYSEAFATAWGMREQLDVEARRREEYEFLPAALSLRDTPVHPAPRIALATVMALLLIGLLWACFGEVDVVASAPGKIVPGGDVKAIQPQDTAIVASIHVQDGQHVKKGDPLIDLDATDSTTDSARARSDLLSTRAELARAHAMLEAIDRKHSAQLTANDGLDAVTLASEQRILDGEYTDYESNMEKMSADIAQSAATIRETNDEIRKLTDTLPLERQKERDYAQLAEKGFVGKHDYYNEQQAVIQMQQDLAAQQSKRMESQAAFDVAQRKRDAYAADLRRTWLEKIHDDSQKAASLEQDLAKATQHGKFMHLAAPVSGTVQHLAAHTVGGVVTPAQVLLNLVPDNQPLHVEAIVDNQDIGFVREGQHVEIKVETFPFARYGTLQGTVVQVANDAKQDDKLGLIFTAQVALASDTMHVDERDIRLTPGMAVTAEIKTGRRRIVSYLLSPLIQHAKESMHER